MIILGMETSCDETGVAVYDTDRGLLAEALHSQVDMHREYGGVVPELASRDHVRRLLPLILRTLGQASLTPADLDAVAYTSGPGLAGALLVGAATGAALAWSLGVPGVPVHHLEGHLLSPLLADPAPVFPFLALLVSGGHTQLLAAEGIGRYRLLGDTLDDAAGEAFDKSAKLMDLPYPGGPALARLAKAGRPGRFRLPRPMLRSGDLDFSFSGLKTAVLTRVREGLPDEQARADLALEVQEAITEVLVAKSVAALADTGLDQLVVAGGVSANLRLRERLAAAREKQPFEVFFPPLALCTDNGAMIAFAAAMHLQAGAAGLRPLPSPDYSFRIRPRWPLGELSAG
ncbi:MAG: tRNA (adenosine(37)-N6)-threonylcarbamoyltransferase complex transferase subunit TsaD [Burkholderiaceae bacterium]